MRTLFKKVINKNKGGEKMKRKKILATILVTVLLLSVFVAAPPAIVTAIGAPPVVTNPTANPSSIPADGTTVSRLNVTVTDDTVVDTVKVDLTQIGGSIITMPFFGDNVYSNTTTAAVGTSPGTYYLPVNATDADGNSNTAVSIQLQVVSPTAKVSISNAAASPRATVTVPINITGVTNLASAEIWLSYNKDVVVADSISDGTIGSVTSSIDNSAGVTKLNWLSITGKTGDFVFVYVTLKAVGSVGQTSTLDLEVKGLTDTSANPITPTVEDGVFEISVPGAAPETTITAGPTGTIDYNDVSFAWTGVDDVTPTAQLEYSYTLEGYDTSWSAWISSTSKAYTDLSNGNYIFKVKARDLDGNIDQTPAERSFTVWVAPSGAVVSIQNAAVDTGATTAPVPINIQNVTNLGTADIWLSYNKDVVIVDSVISGDLGGVTPNIDNTAGVTKMNWFSTTGKSGNYVFAYVILKAVGSTDQTSTLDLTVLELADAIGNPIDHTVEDGLFTVGAQPQLMEGDVSMNMQVTMVDAMFIAQYKAGIKSLNASQLKCADTTDEGVVSMLDAMHIAQWRAGIPFKPLWESPADDDMLPPVA